MHHCDFDVTFSVESIIPLQAMSYPSYRYLKIPIQDMPEAVQVLHPDCLWHYSWLKPGIGL